MKYMGSKARIARQLLPIILKNWTPDRWYVEPFVGGGNMIERVPGDKRIGADANPMVIEALTSIRDHLDELPKSIREFTEDDYRLLRHYAHYPHKGYLGFACSYGGKWMGGWCRDGVGQRDYVREAFLNASKQSPLLAGVRLVHVDYGNLEIPERSIVYCDPPYANTTKYASRFDHRAFWQWCREKAREGHEIYVSEYSAPSDFQCVWEGEIKSSLTRDTGAKVGVERLFVPKIA